MTNSPPSLDWRSWLRRWDAQQTGYLPRREQRFEVMLDVLSELLPEEFVLVDLACGPGSISQRVLERFPKARCIAVDLDPVLLTLGRGALGDGGGRLRWVAADLMTVDLVARLEVASVDAVLSTTALHWLPAERLVALYHQLGRLVRPGGVFLNGDNIPFSRRPSPFQRLAEQARRRDEAKAFGERGVEDWEVWWKALAAEPGMGPLIEERQRLFAGIRRDWSEPLLEVHEAALRDAGFQDVGVLWQHLDDRIILAVR
ncbi:class I SAM-dependent methyltransferase [Cystobacter fuscus]|uniref:class I SAM-dependent methyltransferase n=1 Tax=Cystobacter fuscus TaxID=43 RepID=UPI002B2D6E96|nr:class I SAM-dependent methyltransferase [Cystobacter fuscus]